jgi:translocation protein SEC63
MYVHKRYNVFNLLNITTGEDSADEGSLDDSASNSSGSEDESRDKSSAPEDDDDQWDKFQKRLQKRERLEGRSKSSHPVHCPYFSQVKYI